MASHRDAEEIDQSQTRLAQPAAGTDLRTDAHPSVAAITRPSQVLALQRQIGNAAVGRLLKAERELTPARKRTVQRGFFGSIWSGIKKAASAVASGVKTAATAVAGAVSGAAEWVWNGAKKVGNWAVDWLSKAGTAV